MNDLIPGAREPGRLTRFAAVVPDPPNGPSTMDLATIADRQREGGGAPSQRRAARDGRAWSLRWLGRSFVVL
jgi:hypothetical protein